MPGVIPAWVGVGVPFALIFLTLVTCQLHKFFRNDGR